MLIGLPGINPLIPLWYGILALAIGVAVHEIGHGIMTRVSNMEIKSMGLLFFIFPVGAFVEPDEDALVKSEKKVRTSIYAAGPATNIILAIFCAFMFSTVMVGSAQVASDGPVITSTFDGTPAQMAGLGNGYQIVAINGVPVSYSDIYDFDAPEPGSLMNITYLHDGKEYTTQVFSGLVIVRVDQGLPAVNAGLRSGMIIKSINNVTLNNEAKFRELLTQLEPGKIYDIVALEFNPESNSYVVSDKVKSITPVNRADHVVGGANMAYLGVTAPFLGAGIMNPQAVLDKMTNPFTGASSFGDYVSGSLFYIAMPFSGLQPLDGFYRDVFIPGGIFAGWDSDVFWVTANCFYWIFWINLMLGMTNALPAVPLDGGYLFRDWIDSLVKKV
ncbi:MAG TPA: site-2 protease family protein, partial [Methanomassiliicoccaceae archaeon]|nr:site-2 protease family protein [Methanomassiliicoccaceae archaeon]